MRDAVLLLAAVPGAANQSLGSFLGLAMAMGGLSLLTPCVFPMVPITVSYFSSRGSRTRRGAVLQALIYGLGIVFTFSTVGLAISILFGAGGVNQFAANPWVNLLIAAVFLAFALSLFGVYFIQAPSGLTNHLNSVTSSNLHRQGIGPLLMGLTFALTSFTCTAPFVGTLLVTAARGSWRWPLAGMLAYSTAFALPFFFLALAPQLLSQLPRAGNWMTSVKVVMGFLELAAAMKFISNADLVWGWGILTRQVVLAVWIGCGIAIAVYLGGLLRFPHEPKLQAFRPFRVVAVCSALVATGALVPGLLGRPLGELDSFLPPLQLTQQQPAATGASSAPVAWVLNDLDRARGRAAGEHKLVFIDFSGYTCTNCRWMEANMFTRPEINSELLKFVDVRLYTDGDGSVFAKQQELQQQRFGTVALPLYAIIRPDGATVATFPGLTRDPGEFVRFLREAQSHS